MAAKKDPNMIEKFPSWRYHRTLAPVLVNDPDEDVALGKEWADTPAAFSEPEEVPAVSKSKKSDK
ncbi:MAG TPA: hypothetical protein DEQ40_19135 [Oxalobacteraceae bacterium]|jgi:hypothetical protein|nr:hypothetical protein [Oxalobacteraceae bacterium]